MSTKTTTGNIIQARDLRAGMLVHTQTGKTAIRSYSKKLNGSGHERISISLANGLVYTNLRPFDTVRVG